jgi:acetyl-CoA carboxylase carboxyl transferase subunit alpha
LWKSAAKAPEAAETLAITADRLKALGLVDVVVSEPLGGAHRDVGTTMESLRRALKTELAALQKKSTDKLLAARYERLMGYGKFKESASK